MTSALRALALSCLVLLPLEAGAQSAPKMPLNLGLIPDGEERMFDLIGRLNLERASPEQTVAAAQQVLFSVGENSGFCVAAMAPVERTMLLLTGRENATSPLLFNLSTAPTGITRNDGRRTVLQTIAPITQTTIQLDAVVGQTSTSPGETLTLFIRSYPDQTPRNRVNELCGPALR